jgi:hypothetical protein
MSWRAFFRTLQSFDVANRRRLADVLRYLPRRTGLVLGLQIFVLSAATAQDFRPGYPQQFTMTPKGVNLQKGRFVYEQTDISAGPLKLIRTLGKGGVGSGFGLTVGQSSGRDFNGWTHNYSSMLSIDNSTSPPFYHVTVEGTRYNFRATSTGSGTYPGDAPTQGMSLTNLGSQWVMIDHSGNQYTFAGPASGFSFLLQNVVYANGASTTLTYNGSSQPHLISSSLGYAIVLDYNATQTISAACGYNTAQTYVDATTTCAGNPLVKVSYGYDGSPRLTSVTDARLGVTSIQYAATGNDINISCITLVNSSTCGLQNVYGETMMSSPDQVTTQTTAAGNVWHYDYTPPENPVDVPQKPCWPYWSDASMTDAAGGFTHGDYDRGYLVRLRTPAGTTDYLYPNGCATYGTGGIAPVSVETRLPRPAYVRKPGGVREYYQYDARGNVLERAILPLGTPDPDGLTYTDPDLSRCCVTLNTPVLPAGSLIYRAVYLPTYGAGGAAYGCTTTSGQTDTKQCDKPTAIIDPNGNETDYTYDPAHGGILTETGPAVNGIRPQTRYSYVQRQAWVRSAGSGYVQTGPVWLLVSKSTCKTGAAAASGVGCALGSSDEVITTYDYGPDSGPNNLLLRGAVQDAGGLNLRTCYAYDAQGNKISETKPRGTGATCP